MENRRNIEKQPPSQATSGPKLSTTFLITVLLQILNFAKFSQMVPFLWMVLSCIIAIGFAFAPDQTGVGLMLTLRFLMLDRADAEFQNIDGPILAIAFGRLFLLFAFLLYFAGILLDRLQLNFLRGYRRKMIALVALCLAVFFILNICYRIANVPFTGPFSDWLILFVLLSVALFISGFWAICVGEVANQVAKVLLISMKTQR